MRPVDIEFLIHCFAVREPHPLQDFPAYVEAARTLQEKGLIMPTVDGLFETTERGSFHVLQLCNLKVPTQQWRWVDSNGVEIKR